MLRIKITQNYRKNREANDEFRALSIQRPAQCTKLDMYSIRPAKKQRSGRETHRTGEHLGYIILRERTPACEHRVSDTVVKPPKTFRGDRGERFLTCSVRIGTRETGRLCEYCAQDRFHLLVERKNRNDERIPSHYENIIFESKDTHSSSTCTTFVFRSRSVGIAGECREFRLF